MEVLVTGASGFLGQLLTRELLRRGELTAPSGLPEPIERLVLFDAVACDPPEALAGSRVVVECASGDVADPEALATLLAGPHASVFHLASMVSAGAERDFDGALRVNLDGMRALLDACRRLPVPPRFLFTSSIAAFGAEVGGPVGSDTTKLAPGTTYGMTKAIGELLVNDYTRKGFIDGRSARLPTVVIRPGAPNAAATSWVSGIFREPLRGEPSTLPVERDVGVPIAGYRTVLANLLALHELDGTELGADRALNLPALNVTAGEMAEAITSYGGRPIGPLTLAPDAATTAFFRRWAQRYDFERATRLGLQVDAGLRGLIDEFVTDFLG